MPSLRFIAAVAAFVLSLVATSHASAQSIIVRGETSLARIGADGGQVPKRPLSLNPEAINRDDCRGDQRIRLPVEMEGFMPHSVVQIWASTGSDCSLAENRAGPNARCWNVVQAVPLQRSIEVDVPVRAILSRTSDEAVCGAIDLTRVELQLLMFASATDSLATVSKRIEIIADTIGPDPPRASVFGGNGRARVEIEPRGGITSLTAYCDKSASASACSAVSLLPGQEPDPQRECGTIVSSTGTVLFTDPLANGETHAVAIAARDAFGNVGPLSTVTCATPSADAETKVEPLDEPTGCAVSARASHGGEAFDLGVGTLVVVAALLRAHGRSRSRPKIR